MFGKFNKTGFYILSYSPLYLILLIINYQSSIIFLNSFFEKISNPLYYSKTFLSRIKDPLNFILSISSSTWFFLVLLSLIFISLLVLIKFLTLKGYKEISVSTYTEAGEDIMSYVITYLAPLLSIRINDPNILFANFMLFIIIGIIYTKNNLIYLNPVFIIFGYNVLRDTKTRKLVITNYSIWELRELYEDNKKVLGYKMDESGLTLIKRK